MKSSKTDRGECLPDTLASSASGAEQEPEIGGEECFVECSIPLAVSGLESGLPPQRWLRRSPHAIVAHVLRSLVVPPLAFGAAFVTFMALLSPVWLALRVLFEHQRMLSFLDYAFIAVVGVAEIAAVEWSTARLLERSRGERPLAQARPLLLELTGRLADYTAPQSRFELSMAAEHSVRGELTLRGSRLVRATLTRLPRGRVRVGFELPLAASLARAVDWPGVQSRKVRGDNRQVRVELTLADDEALPETLRQLGARAAGLCVSYALPGRATETQLVRLKQATEPPAEPRGGRTVEPTSPLALTNDASLAPQTPLASALRVSDALACASSALAAALASALIAVQPLGISPLVIGAALVLTVTVMVGFLPLPRRRARQASESSVSEPLALEAGRHLVRGVQQIDLHAPFTVALTREPSSQEVADVGVAVEVRQGRQVLRFSLRSPHDESLELLPAFDAPAPTVDPHLFATELWPALRFYAEAHGERLPWQADLVETDASKP